MSECACCGADDSEAPGCFDEHPKKGGGYVILCDDCSYHYEKGKPCMGF